MVGGSLNLNPLLDWSRGSFRAQVWGIGLFMLSCSRFRGRTSLGFSYVRQVHTPYKAPLGVKRGALFLGILQISSRELGGALDASNRPHHLLGRSFLFGHSV